MKYADDTYLIVPATNTASCVAELGNIQQWATVNNLKLNRAKSAQIIFVSPHSRKTHDDLPTTIDGISRVESLKILGVTVADNISMSNHISAVLTSCAQNLYALRTLRAHGMPKNELQSVFQATALAKLTYASQAWWGFTNAQDRSRLEAFLRRAAKADFYSANTKPLSKPNFSELCETADARLFN